MVTRVAAIGCGTNTIRLLIAEAHRNDSGRPRLEVLRRRNEIVRLDQGVDCIDLLDPKALERTLAAMASHAAGHAELGVAPEDDVRHFVATSATHDTRNHEDFVAGVKRLLGIDPGVASGQGEARLSFTGSLLSANEEESTLESGECEPAPQLVVGLGDGSTELVLGVSEPSVAISLDTGSVRITECSLAADVTPKTEAAAWAEVRGLLDEAKRVVDLSVPGRLVDLAGTITIVTAHALSLQAFDPRALSSAKPSPQAALASCEAIIRSTPERRASWGYLVPGRRDAIAAGAPMWSEVVTRIVEQTVAAGRPLARVTISLYNILDDIALSLVPESGPTGGTPA